MADYTDEDVGRAAKLAGALVEGTALEAELDHGVSLVDIESDASEFRDDLEIISMADAKVPALPVAEGPPVPVSLSILGADGPLWRSGSLGLRGRRYWSRYRRYYLLDALYSASRDGGPYYEGLEAITPEQARENFLTRATDFIATRLAAVRMWRTRDDTLRDVHILNLPRRVGGVRTNIPGCNFSVDTNTHGLSVYWTGAYFISSNFFGHPTSPTQSVLQSGTYIFGIAGGAYGNAIQWDSQSVCSLPGRPSVHLNF